MPQTPDLRRGDLLGSARLPGRVDVGHHRLDQRRGLRHLDQPGDLGARRGRLNPPSVQNGSTQYGIWVTWAVDGEGCRVNGELVGDTKIEDLHLMEESFVRVRLGNRPDARYVGGFNLFGRHFGDYDQDLVLTVEY